MKRIKAIVVLLLFSLMLFSAVGCDTFKPPVSKQVNSVVKIFNNTKLNGAGLRPLSVVIRKDMSGYIECNAFGTLSDLRNSIINAVNEVNKAAYSEGDYLAGYRVLYLREEKMTENDGFVNVTLEFTDINNLSSKTTKSEIYVEGLEHYIEEYGQTDESNNYKDSLGKQSSILKISNKESCGIVICKNLENQALITMENCNISAYYTANENTVITLTGDSIKSSSGEEFKFVYFPKTVPVVLIIIPCVIIVLFAGVLAYRLIRKRLRDKA